MIKYSPNPIFEAYNFLSRHTSGSSISDYVEKSMNAYPSLAEKYDYVLEPVRELERRLTAAIPDTPDVIERLYAPLSLSSRRQEPTSLQNVASLFFVNNTAFEYDNMQDFIGYIGRNLHLVNNAVISMTKVCDRPNDDVANVIEVFNCVNESSFSQKAKLLLIDAALNSASHVEQIASTLGAVAEEFVRCNDLWEPLIPIFRESYCDFSDANDALSSVMRVSEQGDTKHVMYPVITAPGSYTIADSLDENGSIPVFVGFMYELFVRQSAESINSEAELSRMFDILGDKNRLRILKKLGESPAYGRELVTFLGLTPGAVSHQIGILMAAGLVTATTNGTRSYYSLNNSRIQDVICALQTMFPEK